MKKKYLAILFLTSSISALAAAPAKYKTCGAKVIEPKNSNGYYWARDCSTVYIMPPAKNLMKVDSISYSVSDQECSAIKISLDSYLGKIKKLQKKSGNQINAQEIKRLEKKIVSLNKQLEKITSSRINLLNQKEEVNLLMIPLKGAKNQLVKEQSSFDSSSYQYSSLARKINQIDKKISKIQSVLDSIDYQLQIISDKESAVSLSISKANEMIDGYGPVEENNLQEISRLLQEMNAQFAEYKSSYGGTVKVVMENKHTELHREFEKKNKSLVLQRMPVASSVQFKVSGMAGLVDEKMLSINIPGVRSDVDEAIDGYVSVHFGESLSGSVDISTLSACMLKVGQAKRDENIAKFSVNLLHKYDLSVKNDYTISYNLKDIYEKVKSNTSKGGLFKTSSISKIRESVSQSGKLKIEFRSEDPRDNFDKEAKNEIKDKFIARAVEQISQSRIANGSGQVLAMPEARELAARGMAEGLKKCPNLYCQIAGYALDLGSDLFGSKEVSAEFLRTQNFDHSEEVKETKSYTHYTTSTFYKDE